jgi:hypothetical protein
MEGQQSLLASFQDGDALRFVIKTAFYGKA